MKAKTVARSISSWFRAVVPEGYASGTLTLTGTSPLLMNSAEADRDSLLYRTYVTLGQKQKKSLDDEARLRELDWEVRIYLDPDIGPYVPSRNVKGALIEAASKWRKGATLERSLVMVDHRLPLIYDGPRDQASLWKEGFHYTTLVKNAGYNAGRVPRCRPMFPVWSLVADLAFDPEEIDADTLHLIVERSQRYGLGDYRPEFGSFQASLVTNTTRRNGRAPMGAKAKDAVEVQAHQAFKDRIMEPVAE